MKAAKLRIACAHSKFFYVKSDSRPLAHVSREENSSLCPKLFPSFFTRLHHGHFVWINIYNFSTDVTKTENGEWGMGNGEWGMANGE